MEIRYRITLTSDNEFKVECALDPFDSLGDPWSHFGTFKTIDEAAHEAGEEIAHQYKQSLLDDDGDPLLVDLVAQYETLLANLGNVDRMNETEQRSYDEARADLMADFFYKVGSLRMARTR